MKAAASKPPKGIEVPLVPHIDVTGQWPEGTEELPVVRKSTLMFAPVPDDVDLARTLPDRPSWSDVHADPTSAFEIFDASTSDVGRVSVPRGFTPLPPRAMAPVPEVTPVAQAPQIPPILEAAPAPQVPQLLQPVPQVLQLTSLASVPPPVAAADVEKTVSTKPPSLYRPIDLVTLIVALVTLAVTITGAVLMARGH